MNLGETAMLDRQECIKKIKAQEGIIKNDFGVRELMLFGSVARNEQRETSDVDVFVEMSPDLYALVGLKLYLEKLLGCNVDVVRKHRNNDEFLLKQIEKYGYRIIRKDASNMAYA